MSALKEHHLQLLADLIRTGGAPADDVDGRFLRPLRAAGLVLIQAGRVVPTAAGVGVPTPPRASHIASVSPSADAGSLSEAGADALRAVCRQPGGVLADHTDGRVKKALLSRGLVSEQNGWLVPTDAGKRYYETNVRKRRRSLNGFDATAAGSRAEVLHRHIEGLESVLPSDVELMVGDIPCHADDILAALRGHARALERRSSDRMR